VNYNFSIPHTKQLRAFYPCFIGSRASQEGVLRLLANGHLDMTPLISHTPKWSECAELYNRLFTTERDHFNGIVIDWTT
jgi:threonine dehydrogenase-like Zn-dependent dehydrogenase